MNKNGENNYSNNNYNGDFRNNDEELSNDELASQYYYSNNNYNSNQYNNYNNNQNNVNNYNSQYNNYNNNQFNNNYNNPYGNNRYYNNGNNNYNNNGYYNNQFNNGNGFFNNNYNNYSNHNNPNFDDDDLKEEKSKSKKRMIIFTIVIVFGVVFIILTILAIMNLLKSYEISFELNGANKIVSAPSKCKSNIFGHCYVTLPQSIREKGEVVGYSYVNDTTKASYSVGEEIELTEDTKLYVISKEDKKLIIDTSEIDEIESDNVSCSVYNKETSCKVKYPEFNKKGYFNGGYTAIKGNTNTRVYPGESIELTEDKNIYPISEPYTVGSKKSVITNIYKTVKLKRGYIEVTNACSSLGDKAVGIIKEIETKYPFIFINNKITVMSTNEFAEYYRKDDNTKGVTFGNKMNNLSVFVLCDDQVIDIYPVIFHELMHVYDLGTKYYIGNTLSSSEEIYNLAKKYVGTTDRPLRDYAYSKKEEFFAELMTYYYFSYIETTYSIGGKVNYRTGLPDDMKKQAEKYICMGNNNRDESKCLN